MKSCAIRVYLIMGTMENKKKKNLTNAFIGKPKIKSLGECVPDLANTGVPIQYF
jgi:hypothetical protein